ncbi:hypothetical protein [Paenibacillus sp. NPDC058071]|uniref:hypothetical protein n=1 Tax=Paenibacillus sp. NPDC058071 TaxID=3346326 RepID=UPI0036D76843
MNEQIANWNERLERSREKMLQFKQLERRRDQLQTQVNAELKRIVELEVKLDREQEDVEKLLKLSWTNLFHTILRSKKDQLETERQEALAASLKLQQARVEADLLKTELIQTGDLLLSLHSADRDYDRLMSEKEQWMRTGESGTARLLEKLDADISENQLRAKEWYEARAVCRSLVLALEEAVNKLDSAASWGTYDMLGGGMISTSIKHSRIDDAKGAIQTARHLVDRLNKELADVNMTSELAVEIGGMAKFADFFFDGLIADWIVQGKIKDSLQQTLDQLHKARMLLKKLESEHDQSASALASLKREREQLIERYAG